MNERIRELAEQADKWAGTEFHRLFLSNINANMKELFEGKFAELVVRECRLAVNRIDVESPEASIALTMADAAIRDCLGVE
jgi:hypothetical protein